MANTIYQDMNNARIKETDKNTYRKITKSKPGPEKEKKKKDMPKGTEEINV